MGKRELLLIVSFVVVGAVVYQATAPPPAPGERSFSLSRIVDHIRREVRGNPGRAETTRVVQHELEREMREIHISGGYVDLTVTGEDRADVETRWKVSSNGYDDAEAQQLVEQTVLNVDRAGRTLRLSSTYPRPGSQRAYLEVRVPAGVSLRVDANASRTRLANLNGVELTSRGEATLKQIRGRAVVNHRGGRLSVEDASSLKLDTRGGEVSVTSVSGDASFAMQSGELRATGIRGPIDIEARNADISLKNLEQQQGLLRVTAAGGTLQLQGVRGEARIDGRNTEIDVEMAKPAPVAIHNEGDEPIELTAPPGGFVLDAMVSSGRLTLPDEWREPLGATREDDDGEQRASGAVRGGGPTITLRANRGAIRIQDRERAPQ